RGEFPPPRQVKSSIPAALAAICSKAMALKPADRYASARALADDIEHWLADEPVSAWRGPWHVRLRRWARRHRALAAGVGTAVLVSVLLAGGYGLWLAQTRAETAQQVEAALDQAAK